MSRFTEREATCRVFTFKEGLLSAVAHDLELDVQRLTIEWPDDRSSVRAVFDARSLHVLHAMHDGHPNPSGLSDRDKRKIEGTIVDEVLHASRAPEIVFEASVGLLEGGSRARLEGTLRLAGRSRPIVLEAVRRGDAWICATTLHQPDFGITPYSAMLGTLKIKPDVRVEIRVPHPAG
jgi:hypothetical protein